jgi:hypothetical protein
LPALAGGCGLSDYEALMVESQEREQRFREESTYLGEPINVPTRKEKDTETPLADIFFRPPKGIPSTPDGKPRGGLLYRYAPRSPAGDFALLELAFGSEEKDFAATVRHNFQAWDPNKSKTTRQVRPPGRAALSFDVYDFADEQYSYSAYLWQGGRTQVAIVFYITRGRRDSARKVMDISLESFAADSAVLAARREYARKTPWRLKGTAGR